MVHDADAKPNMLSKKAANMHSMIIGLWALNFEHYKR